MLGLFRKRKSQRPGPWSWTPQPAASRQLFTESGMSLLDGATPDISISTTKMDPVKWRLYNCRANRAIIFTFRQVASL